MSSPAPTDPAYAAPATGGALIRRTIRRHRRPLGGAIGLITVWQVCELMVPVLIGVVIDRAVATGDIGAMVFWGAALCLHFVVLSLAYRFGAKIGFTALQRESHSLRTEVSAHVLAPRGARSDRLPGDVLTIATSDADMVGTVLRQIPLTVAAVIGLAVSAVVLATIDLFLAAVVLVGVPAVLVVIQLLAPRLARRSEARQEALGRATGIATDLVQGVRPLKGIGAEDTALARYRTQSQDAAVASVGAARWEGVLVGVTDGLSGVFLAVVALVAGLRAVEGDIGIGELVAVVGLAQFVAEPMTLLTYLIAQLAQARASAGRIVTFLATPPLVLVGDADGTPDGADHAAGHGLTLQSVAHGSLQDVTFHARPGSMLAVVAEDPADAAALMTLLRGEQVPASGSLRLGDTVVTDLRIEDTRARMLVADHHVDLFEGTLLSNVDPAGTLDDDRLAAVLAASAADDVVSHSALGLEEPVRVGGTTLSGGQRQRLGLARALARDAPVLVLHDPTTAVDAVTEQRIADALVDVRHGDATAAPRTTVLLTSSPALLARAHAVVHLRGGRVVGSGTHHELVDDEAYRAAVLR